ncbi:MAG: trigger factor [Clostridiales Family XIII bacterium]|jgi:trigger factor|nr:trigger factor [Clostridiales Family XIII bacterium]
MNPTFLSKDHNKAEFTMEFTAEEFESAQIKAYREERNHFAVDGFRKGKAPKRIIEIRYGEDVFFEKAVTNLVNSSYEDALYGLDIEAVDAPEMDFSELKKGDGFVVTVKVDAAPEIAIKDYREIRLPDTEYAVSEEDIDKELEILQNRNARLLTIERPAELGDTLMIDYAGFIGDEPFEGGTAERQPLKLGSETFIPGFEDQLVGAKPGEERDVRVTFPENYGAESLAGKEALFRCKVHEIKMEEKPEINDEFAQDVSEFDTLDELRESVRVKLEDAAAKKNEYEKENALLDKLCEANDVEIPDAMVKKRMDEMMDEMMDEFETQFRDRGLNVDNYLSYINQTKEGIRENFRDGAHKTVKTKLLLKAVAKTENIDASDEEVDKELNDIMTARYASDAKEMIRIFASDNRNLRKLKEDVINRKTLDFLLENAIVAR